MRKRDRFKKKITDYFFDHPVQREAYRYSVGSLVSAFSGMLFAFGFSTFITSYSDTSLRLATGGFSGFTQSIVMILTFFNPDLNAATMQGVFYFIFNIPALIFAFFKIGKRFAVTSAVNVGLSSLFISLFSNLPLIQEIANNEFIAGSPLTRVLFAGVFAGVSSGIAFKGGTSCGGMDIVSCYFSVRKSTGIGKYNVIANSLVIIFYTLINVFVIVSQDNGVIILENIVNALLIVPFAFVYFLVSSLVIDVVHVRNKKISVEIITKNENLSDILITIFPHSSTIFNAKGAYTKSDELVVKMIVSSFETKKVVDVVKKIDSNAFIALVPLQQVYGNFFINPIE